MRTEIRRTKNLCGYYVGKPIRVTVNMAGNYWVEPVGWKREEASWLTLPHTKPIYISAIFK